MGWESCLKQLPRSVTLQILIGVEITQASVYQNSLNVSAVLVTGRLAAEEKIETVGTSCPNLGWGGVAWGRGCIKNTNKLERQMTEKCTHRVS